jgi:hypothetical protein
MLLIREELVVLLHTDGCFLGYFTNFPTRKLQQRKEIAFKRTKAWRGLAERRGFLEKPSGRYFLSFSSSWVLTTRNLLSYSGLLNQRPISKLALENMKVLQVRTAV